MHSSESILGVRENFTACTLEVHTHFFSKTGYDQRIFSKKSWKLFLFKNVLAFQPKDIFSLCIISFPF